MYTIFRFGDSPPLQSILNAPFKVRDYNSSVSRLANGQTTRVWCLDGTNFSLSPLPDYFWTHPASYLMKTRGGESNFLSRIQITMHLQYTKENNVWHFNFTSPYATIMWCCLIFSAHSLHYCSIATTRYNWQSPAVLQDKFYYVSVKIKPMAHSNRIFKYSFFLEGKPLQQSSILPTGPAGLPDLQPLKGYLP